ncbi:glycosyltransferase involved in cell wall biosynthesis [Rhodoblastus sphagnicola]|uniref:glycosyltransferase n=1 Tax=Rhodoblastus sphagnicola TaxID=333368 RepID=UPI001304FC4E|nr:glycosyltransferase [Rhodoblastus sphagnicola]MBB4198647.1 glycosyltransferase involved in cell wall biosynthesis [Rhodoblastus sphagnicola]
MHSDTQIDIVFPCYNAAQWIDHFIEDLSTLDCAWRLVARDDGSADATADVLRKWRDRLGPRMLLVDGEGPSPNLGIIGNYNKVLAATTAPWILTADPDDRWLPNRVALTLGALRAAEAKFGEHTPIAISTDAQVVDHEGRLVAASYWRWTRSGPPARSSTRRTAMESAALGSTMAVNRALLAQALPMPPGAVYQDWWMALVAIAFGQLILLPDITMRYLRHGANATKDPFTSSLSGALGRLVSAPTSARQRVQHVLGQASRQAGAFADIHAARLPADELAALKALARFPQLGPLERRLALVRHGLWFNSSLKNIGLFLLA